jgi:hypothetical protein
MIIKGTFKDINDNAYTVEINNSTVTGDTITIGEKYNDTDSDLLYFSENPVELEQKCDDLFDEIIMQSATIELYARDFIADKLYSENDRSTSVVIKKGNTVYFNGYAEAGTFDQEFSNPYDSFSINCIDKLSTLQYHKYKDITTIEKYNLATPELSIVSFKELLDEMFSGFTGCSIFYDCSKGLNKGSEMNIFDDLSISEQVFVGDDYDSVDTHEDILRKILKYLNLHIIQQGNDFYIFDWKSLGNNIKWYNLSTKTTTTQTVSTITLDAERNASDETKVSVDDVYNQMQLKCELNSQDVIVKSPLDSDSLYSYYTGRQKFMSEFVSEIQESNTKSRKEAAKAWQEMLAGKKQTTNFENVKRIDWYMQDLQCKNWKIYSISGDTASLINYDDNGVPIYQNNVSTRLRNNLLEPAIISLGSVEYEGGRVTDNSPKDKLSMTSYLVFSLNGRYTDRQVNDYTTKCEAYHPTEDELSAVTSSRSEHGLMEYIGANSGGVFSPADDDTTNYLVFSGKICYVPWMHDSTSDDTEELFNDAKTKSVENFFKKWEDDKVSSQNAEAGKYYTRVWYNPKYPAQTITTADEEYEGLQAPVSDMRQELQYNYSYDGNDKSYTDNDLTTNVSVFDCELIIGDKRLIQKSTTSGDTLEWIKLGSEPTETDEDGNTHTLKTFSLGINPKIDDYLIGTDFEIRTNLDFTANIDGGGFAVPIKKSDNLSGKIIFRIMGIVNETWDNITRRHKTWFRHTKYFDNPHYLLAHTECIYVKDFKVEFQSDNGGINTDYQNDDRDLIYVSQEKDNYVNIKDDLSFELITQPTTHECIEAECKTGNNYNAVLNDGACISSIYNALTDETYKAEEFYVDQYYNFFNEPKIILETEVWDSKDITTSNTYRYNALARDFFITGTSRTLAENKIQLTLREK